MKKKDSDRTHEASSRHDIKIRGVKNPTAEDMKNLLAEFARKEAEYQKQQRLLPFHIKALKFAKNVVKDVNHNPLALVALLIAGQALCLKFIPRE